MSFSVYSPGLGIYGNQKYVWLHFKGRLLKYIDIMLT